MRYLWLAALLFAVPAQAGLFNPLSTVTDVVEAAAEDRSTSDIATDAKLKAKIVAAVADALGKDAVSVTTDVYEQDVMLTGTAKTADIKAKAAATVKTVAGVRKILNELMLPTAADKGMVKGFVDDTVIEKKVEANLVSAKGVSHTNWRWHSVNGTVFLFGRSLSKAESTKVEQLVKSIDNVVGVVDRAKVKPKG